PARAEAAKAGTVEVVPPAPAGICEVEVSGNVVLPAAFASEPAPMTFVALGDCLAPSAKMLGFGGSCRGRFFVEVFAPWGSDLTLCAASEPSPGAPSTLYGKAKIAMHAEHTGEVEFKDVVVELASAPPHPFPHTAGN